MNQPPTEIGSSSRVQFVLCCFVVSAIAAAVLGVFGIGSELFVGNKTTSKFLHIPFWTVIGLATMLGNYIPIVKGKPIFFPVLGMLVAVITFGWFSIDNFVDIKGIGEFFGRFKLGLFFLIACYSTTHISLLTLAHRRNQSNALLYSAIAVILISTVMYFLWFYGSFEGDFDLYAFGTVAVLFFIKIAMTIAVICLSLVRGNSSHPYTLPPTV